MISNITAKQDFKNSMRGSRGIFLGDQRVNQSSTHSFVNVMQGGWRTARKNRAEVREKISCVLSVRCGIYNLSIDIYSMLNFVFVGSNKFVHIYIITRDLLNLLDMFRFHNPFVYCMFANTWGFKLILSLSRWFPVLGSGKIRCYMTCVEFAPWQQTNLRFMPFMLQMSFAQGTYTAVCLM